jgi:hypothetical protein
MKFYETLGGVEVMTVAFVDIPQHQSHFKVD